MIKDFDAWNNLKQKLERQKNPPSFKERQIWWCSLGVNIGCEENGKSSLFSRPILIIKKFNKNIFLGIPLTTKIKENRFHYKFSFNQALSCAMLSQIRVLESKRLRDKMGEISEIELDLLRRKIKEMI